MTEEIDYDPERYKHSIDRKTALGPRPSASGDVRRRYALTTIAALIGAWILLSLLANVMVLPVWFKIIILLAVAASAVYLFGRFAIRRLFDGDIDQVAVGLEQKHADLKGRLIAAIQFSRMPKPEGFSQELIDYTERQAYERTAHVDFNEIVTFNPVLKTSRYFAVSAVIAVAMLLLFPGLFSYSYKVYSNPTTEVAPPLGYSLTAVPGATEWVKYRDIQIGGLLTGRNLPATADVYHRFAGGNWQKTRLDLTAQKPSPASMGDSLPFGLTLRQVAKSFDYYVEAGDLKTEVQKIDVVDRPRITGIALNIFYPDYTGLKPQTIDENNGSFSAVVGSRVNMKIEANLPVQKAELVFDDSSRTPIEVNSKTGDVSLRVDKSRGYYIHLVDHLGEFNPDPIQYYITAVPDEYPSIDVVRPGFDANLTDEMILPLKVRILDDYGFTSLVMKYTITSRGTTSQENVAILHFSDKIKTEGDVEFNWDMDKLNLYPGDFVTYQFEIADNDRITGPKVTKSRPFIARLPSLDEIITEQQQEGEVRIAKTEDVIKSGQDLVQRLKQISRKIDAQSKTSQTTDWQQQKEIESLAEKNQEMMRQLEQLSQQMDSSVQKMQDNALTSREIMEKMQQIQKLFEEVASPEMREAQKKLMEALQKMDRQQLQEAMKKFEMSQKELLDRLERTLALLKKMQLEQKMEAMIRKAEELARRQEQMNQKADASKSNLLPSMSKQEDEIKQGLDELKKEIADLDKLAEEAKMKDSPEAQKFAEAVKKTDADQDMSNMSQSLQKQQKDSASKEGKSAHSKLLKMIDEMQTQQMAMQGGDSEKIRQAMRRAIDDANTLSQNQEDLMKEAGTMDQKSLVLHDMAASEQDILSAAAGLKNTIDQLGKQSPFIAAELNQLLNQAAQNMDMATQQFEAKNGVAASTHQREAMVNLNKASTRLLESLDAQKQCDKGGACNKPMASLESLSQRQKQLNQKTSGQCNNPQEGPGGKPFMGDEASGGQRAELQRLAGEQGAIRQSMQELEAQFGDSRQVLGRLSDIASEMKKVEEDMAKGDVGPETTERQLKIYSRMLEASRTLQRKDFTEQRKATTATEQQVYAPPTIPQELLNDKLHFEDRLRQFLGKDLPPQYEEQIRAYFRILLNGETAPTPTSGTVAPQQ